MNSASNLLNLELHTERLILRTISDDHADALHPLINDPMVLDGLVNVPYPYPKRRVSSMIMALRESISYGECIETTILLRDGMRPIGICGLRIDRQNEKADIGYWLGRRYWNNGYMTEAVLRLIEYGFHDLGLYRVHARCFAYNEASVKVLTKCGMKPEGCAKGDIFKNGKHIDVLHFGLLAVER